MYENIFSEQRREFLKKAGLLLGAGASVSALSSLIVGCKDETISAPLPPVTIVDISKYPELLTVGGIALVNAKSRDPKDTNTYKYIVRRFADNKFIAVQSYCSHQPDRELDPVIDANGNTHCPRHGAIFSLNQTDPGALVDGKGVAGSPLKSHECTLIDSNTLEIKPQKV